MGLVAGIIFAKLGVHWSNLVGCVIYILAAFIMYSSARFYLDMISSILYGISCAILAFPSTINTCKYFMNRVGLVNGIIATLQSIGTTFFTYIGEQMINPEKVQSDPKDHLYNKEISSRVKYFLLLQIFCILGSFIVCEMLIKTYDENNKEECGIKFLFKINEIKSLCKKKS
jgi:fucose permease